MSPDFSVQGIPTRVRRLQPGAKELRGGEVCPSTKVVTADRAGRRPCGNHGHSQSVRV
jgi:hypothetical protein